MSRTTYKVEQQDDGTGAVINPATEEKQDIQIAQDAKEVSLQDLDNKLTFLLDRLEYGEITDKTKTLLVGLNPILTHNIGTLTTLTTLTTLANIARQGDLQTQRLNEAILDAAFINGITNNLAF